MIHAIPVSQFPASSAFIRRYAAADPGVLRWFHYDPHDAQVLDRRLEELRGLAPGDRDAVSAAVLGQQRRWQAGPAALAAAEKLAQPNTFSVVTGQQAGLFGGPLYTQLKAVSAVKLARQLAARYPDCNFVPMFWMATGDSDFDEVRSTTVLNRAGQPGLVELPPQADAAEGLVVARREVRAGLDALLAQSADWLGGGEHLEAVREALARCYEDGGLVEGFARWMAQLFDGTELLLLDPEDQEFKIAGRDLLSAELRDPGASWQAIDLRSRDIEAAGFEPQVVVPEGDTTLFMVDGEGRREKVTAESGGFVLRPSGQEFSASAMGELATKEPQRFIPGVMLRPLFQNLLVPPVAFIGGAAEIAYRAQCTALFDLHNMQMAPAFLRGTATLLPENIARFMAEQGWELADCLVPPQDLAGRAAGAEMDEATARAITAYRAQIGQADSELKAHAVAIDPNLAQTFETLRANLDKHIDKLEKKITSSLKNKNESKVRQAERLSGLVYPNQALQERQLNLLSFLPRYGFGIIGKLMEQLAYPGWDHQVLELG